MSSADAAGAGEIRRENTGNSIIWKYPGREYSLYMQSTCFLRESGIRIWYKDNLGCYAFRYAIFNPSDLIYCTTINKHRYFLK
jgi:hypothetical protein